MELKPMIIRNNVVFPQPDGPNNVKNSPGWIFRDNPLITVVSSYFLITLSTSIETLITILLTIIQNGANSYIGAIHSFSTN